LAYHSLNVNSIPQGDRRNDQVESAGTVSLIFERAIADFAESIEEHGTGERVLGLSFGSAWYSRAGAAPGLTATPG